jgi:ABC-type branched-subunit amino acid transport system permease subunit
LTRKQRFVAVLALPFVILVAATVPGWLSSYYVQLATRALIVSMVTMSFVILAGYGGMVSLAQMSFFCDGWVRRRHRG